LVGYTRGQYGSKGKDRLQEQRGREVKVSIGYKMIHAFTKGILGFRHLSMTSLMGF
jgi:hypothetical protein